MSQSLAGIQYAGEPGSTRDCFDSIVRLIQCREQISSALLITAANRHCFLLTTGPGDLVAIKSGFSSGYVGEGPRGLSRILCLLNHYGTEIGECETEEGLIKRLNNSALTSRDVKKLLTAARLRPTRWHDYVDNRDLNHQMDGSLWRFWCNPVMPLSIIDSRIMDLATSFWEDPDKSLLTGYRRLEDIIRKRTGLRSHSTKLFSCAFFGKEPKLGWPSLDEAEQQGRGQLFGAATMAFRNRRAHQEIEHNEAESLIEFLQMNTLFVFERKSVNLEIGITADGETIE